MTVVVVFQLYIGFGTYKYTSDILVLVAVRSGTCCDYIVEISVANQRFPKSIPKAFCSLPS